jgi:Tfp pilus assembly protein PilP
MLRSLLLLLLLAGCSKGAAADLQYIAQARSVAAEWALVNEQAAQGRLTNAYILAMRTSLREQAKAAAAALTQHQSAYGHDITALAAEREDASPEVLRAHSARLKQVEDGLESA